MFDLPKSTLEILNHIESKTQRSSRVRITSSQTSVQSLERLHRTDSDHKIKTNILYMNNSRGSIKSHLMPSFIDSILNSNEQSNSNEKGKDISEKQNREITKIKNKDTILNLKPKFSNRLAQLRSKSEEVKNESLTGSIILSQRSIINDCQVSENNIRSINSSQIFFNKKEFENKKEHENKSKLLWVEKLQSRSSNFQQKIDRVVTEAKLLVKEGFWDKNISQLTQTFFLHFRFLLEKAHSKSILFPETDKEIAENLLIINSNAVKLLKGIQNNVKILLTEQRNSKMQLKAKNEEIKKLHSIIEEHKSDRLTSKEEKELIKTLEFSLKKEQLNLEKVENIWSVEKQQFQAEIKRLEQEIVRLQASEYIKLLESKYDLLNEVATVEIRKLNEEGEKKDTEIAKLETLLERTVFQLKETKNDLDGFKTQNSKCVSELKVIKEKETKYFNSQNMYREIAQMAKEEILQVSTYNKFLKGKIIELRANYDKLQFRFDNELSNHINNGGFSLGETQKDMLMINATKDIFTTIKHPLFPTNISSNKKNQNKEISQNHENIQIEKYSLFKPTFFLLIDQEEILEKLKQSPDVGDIRTKPSREFIGIIRGIFDSKFNEFMYYNNVRQHSPFPDFVYSWLNCFHICPFQKCVRAINAQDKIPVDKRTRDFYKFLLNPYVNKLWDVEVFKSFLDEKYASDELFFYLFCRNILFEGPQLRNLAATENVIHWVVFEKIEAAMKKIFQQFEEEQYSVLRKRIRGRARVKHDKTYGDTALFLKILLEFYRNEKKKKFEVLKREFINMSLIELNAKPHVPFKNFKQFLEVNFPFLTDVEKARVYRETWCIGNGVVDAESFFIIANENNLFMEELKSFLCKKVSINDDKCQLKASENGHIIKTCSQKTTDSLEVCKNFAGRFGIEQILVDIVFKQTEFTQFSNFENASEKYMYQIFIDALQLMIKTRNLYCMTNQSWKENLSNFTETDIKMIERILNPFEQLKEEEKKERLQKEANAQKIQEFFRIKKSNWYEIIRSIATEDKKHSLERKELNVNGDLFEDKYFKNGIVDLF